jgi:hypothetical protein
MPVVDSRVAFAGEKLSITTGNVVPTAATYAPASQPPASAAMLSIEGFDIRVRFDGTNPDSTTGALLAAGGIYEINGVRNISQLKMTRDTTATGNATVFLEYLR